MQSMSVIATNTIIYFIEKTHAHFVQFVFATKVLA